MAFNQFDVNHVSTSLTASTAETVVGVAAASNIVVLVLELLASLNGATSSNAPTLVEFQRNTFAANAPGTNSTSFTTANGKRDPGRAETIQATAATVWTTEPTVATSLDSQFIPSFNGRIPSGRLAA
jgi:hypothetical protein